MASREEPPKPQPSSTSIKCPHPGACELLIASREIWSNQPFRTEAKSTKSRLAPSGAT